MKNCAVALCGSPVLAIEIVPRLLERPFFDSFSIGWRVIFFCMLASKPPPWIMKSAITR